MSAPPAKDGKLADYIDVRERISAFHKEYPDGSLQTISWEVREIRDQTFVVYRAAAYRTQDDRRPGHGIAWEPFPGPTAFTRNSELMNAETAAWGRAIVALGLPASRQIASIEEVRNRQAEREQPPAPPQPPEPQLDEDVYKALVSAIKEAKVGGDWVRWQLIGVGVQDVPEKVTPSVLRRLSLKQANEVLGELSVAVDRRNETDGD